MMLRLGLAIGIMKTCGIQEKVSKYFKKIP